MSKNVQLVKLVNNELLIGDVEDVESDPVVINKPFQVGVIQDQLALIDFNSQLGRGEGLSFARANVLYVFKANEQVEELYLEKSTGIQMAGAGIGGGGEGLTQELDLNDLTS